MKILCMILKGLAITVLSIYNNLAYCPLDLPSIIVDENLVNLLIDYHNPGHHDGIWETLPLIGRVDSQKDFKNALKFELAWEKRYNTDGEILKNKEVEPILKSLFDHIELLPINVTHAQILRATKSVPKHFDMKHKNRAFINDLPKNSFEPNGWKILINKTSEQSFYVCKTFESEPVYIKLPKDTNTFVINEKSYPHGSEFIQDKCVVSIFGLVDKDKAINLIEKSLLKYKDYVIEF